VAIASNSALDCALVDIALIGESALPVAEILADRHVPFVFMTGADDPPLGKFHNAPVLLKPFTVQELRFTLQRILSSERSPKEPPGSLDPQRRQ
jgi:two-component system, chemotaxis family, sensor kinase Cph1